MANYSYMQELNALHWEVIKDYINEKEDIKAKKLEILLQFFKAYQNNRQWSKTFFTAVQQQSGLIDDLTYDTIVGLFKGLKLPNFMYNNWNDTKQGVQFEKNLTIFLQKVCNRIFEKRGIKKDLIQHTGGVQGTTLAYWNYTAQGSKTRQEIKDFAEAFDITESSVKKAYVHQLQEEEIPKIQSSQWSQEDIKVDVNVGSTGDLTIKSKYANSKFFQDIQDVLNNASFSAKSYGSSVTVSFGNTNLFRILLGMTQINYSAIINAERLARTKDHLSTAKHLYFAGFQVTKGFSYYNDNSVSFVRRLLNNLRFIYELTGRGIYVQSDKKFLNNKEVKYLVFNDPTTIEVEVIPVSKIIKEVLINPTFSNTDDPYGIPKSVYKIPLSKNYASFAPSIKRR